MNSRPVLTGLTALLLAVFPLVAQEAEADKLKLRLRELEEKFEKQQQEMKANFERLLREQQAELDALKQQLARMSATNTTALAASTNAPTTQAVSQDIDELKQQVKELTTASKRTFISQFNPGIGVVFDSVFSYTSRGQETAGLDRPGGFDAYLRSLELNLEASVDPFARAYGVINGSADAHTGDASIGVEEAAIVTTSLPWGLTAQGGRFFGEFGRFSYIHDHELPSVFRPLVLDRYVGGESRTDGLQVNYLLPSSHFFSLTLGLGNGFGSDIGPVPTDGYRSLSGVNYFGRFSTYFDLTPNLNLEMGLSGLANSEAKGLGNDPTERDRYVGDLDVTLRYQPLASTVYRGWVWGTELLLNSANFELTQGQFEREASTGLYSYFEQKLSRRWKVGFLFDWVQSPSNDRAQTFRYSPFIAWNPSEFQMLRLQFSHTEPTSATGLENSEAIYLQWDAIIGRHVHGFKQR